MTQRFAQRERLWLGIAPEGTRKRMPKWKTGFWHIARAADVPILPIAFHYPDKTINVGPLQQTSSDVDADIARLGERFFRVLGTEQSGSGLGWSIVRRLAQRYQLDVRVDRSPGLGGLRVSLCWPSNH